MGFIRNVWYVAGWNTELAPGQLLAREIIGQPLVLFRRKDGMPVAFEDRCPHRMAPLSAGRLEGDELRCMYHGLRFNQSGVCTAVPGTDSIPPRLTVRSFPAADRSGWIWVWLGDPAMADPDQIPDAWGLNNPDWHLKEGALDYDADYQLINDNLLDLTHLDYVHEKTLGAATGGRWSDKAAEVSAIPNGVYVWRWLRNAKPAFAPEAVDSHTSYRFLVPGLFLQHVRVFPAGTSDRHPDGTDLPEPIFERIDQQSVTPIGPGRSRYCYATGLGAKYGDARAAAQGYEGLQEAFMQDKTMIEAQARVLAHASNARPMAYIPQDKAPTMFRRLIADRLAAEAKP